MNEIDSAIAAFESDPSDENAQEISLATMVAVSTAFMNIPDGEPVQPALFDQLERAHSALASVTHCTEIIRHYASAVLFRSNVLRERHNGNHAAVGKMLREALAA